MSISIFVENALPNLYKLHKEIPAKEDAFAGDIICLQGGNQPSATTISESFSPGLRRTVKSMAQ